MHFCERSCEQGDDRPALRYGNKGAAVKKRGLNNVDIGAAKGRLPVLRVPSYSPEAVAEYALAMLMTVNRRTHKAYNRTRDFNMNINGLMGTDLNHKVAGVIGTGRSDRQ